MAPRLNSKEIYAIISGDPNHEVFGDSKLPKGLLASCIALVVVPPVILLCYSLNFPDLVDMFLLSPLMMISVLLDILIILPISMCHPSGRSKIIINNRGVGQVQFQNRVLAFEWKHIDRISIRWSDGDIDKLWFARGSRYIRTGRGQYCRNFTLRDLKRFIVDFDSWPSKGKNMTYHTNPHYQ